MKLKTGVDPTSRISFKNTRGLPFHGMGAFVGIGKTQRAHVYTAASIPVDPEAYKKIDPKKLAVELGVDMCAVNSGRFWMMDEIEFVVGERAELPRRRVALGRGHDRGRDGLPVPERLRALADPAQHGLDLQGGQTGVPAARAWRPGLGPAGIHQGGRPEPDPRQPQHVGRQAEEPAGRLEVRNQGADRGPDARYRPLRRLGSDHSRRPALHLPGLWLRRGHERQLCAVNGRCLAKIIRTVCCQSGASKWRNLFSQVTATTAGISDTPATRQKPGCKSIALSS